MVELAANIWRDGPGTDPYEPDKWQIRQWGTWLEGIITAFTSNGGLIYSTKAAMDADLSHTANSMAWVIGDPVAANNGVYGKIGASGSGSWTRRADLPFSFIIASDAGAGAANAIQATTSIPVSASALIWMNVFEANTASPVTVSFNGGPALTIKTNSGNDIAAGGLVAGMIVLGIVSGSTFRLVSDQSSTAIAAAAEAAQVAAEAAQAAAEAAAAGVDLPPVAANTMLVDNPAGTARESKTFGEVRDLLDPLRGFNANGSTDDTANFTALRAAYPNRTFDLDGDVYKVTDFPAGQWLNGEFVKPGGGEGGGTIRKDALKLRRETSRLIASGDYHFNWPQGKNGLKYNGTLFAAYMEGGGHEATDIHVRLVRSSDNGSSWSVRERLFQTAGAARSCWAATVIHGRLFLVIRIHSGAHNDATITGATIYSRRIYERREKKNNPVTGVDATNMEVRATNGSATFRIANSPKHGMLVGSVFNITNVGATVGGRTVSGNYTVTAVGADWFEFTHPSGAATSTQTATSDFTVRFLEEPTWTEHLFGGDTIYTKVTQFPGTTRNGSNPFYFHGAAEIKSDTSGAMYLGVTGGNAGPAIAKVTGLLNGTPTLSKMKEINSNSARGEPAFAVASNGTLVGFLRSNDATLSGGLFYSTDDITNITHRLNVTGSANDFRYAPFGIDIDTTTDTVYAVTTGNRIRGTAGTMQAGEVPVYKLVGSVTDIVAGGWPALDITEYRKIWFANESQGDTGNGVGVGACAYQDGILHAFMATETTSWNTNTSGSPNIAYDRLYVAEPGIEQAASRQIAAVDDGERSVQYAGRFAGYGAAHILGKVNDDGTIAWGHGFTITNPAAGRYDLKLNKDPGHQQWFPVVMVDSTTTTAVSGTHFNNTTFSIRLVGGVNRAFFVLLFVDYQPYRTDWGGDIA